MSNVYESYESTLPPKLIEEIRESSKSSKLTESEVSKVLKRVSEEYERSKIHPGEGIGIVTAESFGEPGTQMVLNVFHLAGVSEVQVTTGLPRLIEILDARKEPSSPLSRVYLKHGYKTDVAKVKAVAALIKETKLDDISTEMSLNLTQFRIEVALDRPLMRDLKITSTQVMGKIRETFKDIDVSEDSGVLKLKSKVKESLGYLYQLKEKLKELTIKGVKGIDQITTMKKDNEYIIYCNSTKLKKLYEVEGVDSSRTVCNSLFVIADVLGIETARNIIINEALDVINDQGLDIDLRHILFLADLMTTSGTIRGITRSGITAEKESVLARASFETPIKHIVEATLKGQVDYLNSVIENVMLNQPVPLGTGLPDLVAVVDKEAIKGKKKQ